MFEPRHAVYTSQVETAARLASAGAGPTLVPENTIPSDLNGSVVRADPRVGREVVDLMRDRKWSSPPAGATVVA